MTEQQIHKQLISFGNLPLTIVIRDLEEEERYLECAQIKNAIESYIMRFPFLAGEFSTVYSEELEDEYLDAFKHYCPDLVIPLARNTIYYYVAEIKKNLGL